MSHLSREGREWQKNAHFSYRSIQSLFETATLRTCPSNERIHTFTYFYFHGREEPWIVSLPREIKILPIKDNQSICCFPLLQGMEQGAPRKLEPFPFYHGILSLYKHTLKAREHSSPKERPVATSCILNIFLVHTWLENSVLYMHLPDL